MPFEPSTWIITLALNSAAKAGYTHLTRPSLPAQLRATAASWRDGLPPDLRLSASEPLLFDDVESEFDRNALPKLDALTRAFEKEGLPKVHVWYEALCEQWLRRSVLPLARLNPHYRGDLSSVEGQYLALSRRLHDVMLADPVATNKRMLTDIETLLSVVGEKPPEKKSPGALARFPEQIPQPLDTLLQEGRYLEGYGWIVENWVETPSWEALVCMLRTADMAAIPARATSDYMSLRNRLTTACDAPVGAAERYYLARIRGTRGWIADAMRLHLENRDTAGDTYYGLRSLFEVGQLLFRLENFDRARAIFLELLERVDGVAGALAKELQADVHKFLGTMAVIHTVYDFPYRPGLDRLSTGLASDALASAQRAVDCAEEAGYRDGVKWGIAVRAFAQETSGDFEAAEDSFRVALGDGLPDRARAASQLHIGAYYGGFLRRRRRWVDSEAALRQAGAAVPAEERRAHDALLLEQWALLARGRKKPEDEKRFFRKAVERYAANDPALATRLEWPKVQRIRRTGAALGIDIDKVFLI